jgi:hypothetical protein
MKDSKPHDLGYVLGNGPSRDRSRKQYDGVTYGCNSIHKEMDVNVLVCMDVWYQFEVISSGYPAEHECLFGGYNPMPIGVKPEDLNPPHYGIHYYNPEDRKYADSWYYYATSTVDYERAVKENYTLPYWKPDCGYVCWVTEGYKIKDIDYGVLPLEDTRPPSGAYALQEALRGGHDRVEVIGFDSIAGVFSTSSQLAFKEHDSSENTIIQDRMDNWVTFYKTIAEHYNEIEIIWHTKED